MTKLEQIKAAEARLLLSTYERNPILFVGGTGVHLIDEGGERYLDLLSGFGVFAIGRNHPALRDALKSVLDSEFQVHGVAGLRVAS